MSCERVGDHVARLGECPLWSVRDGCLYWIDIEGRAVHRLDPASDRHDHRMLDVRPGAIALTADPDRLLVAAEHQLLDLAWSTGDATPRLDLEDAGPGKRLNDGRCDPSGRFWVGSMDDPPTELRGRGRLHRVAPDGSATTHRDGIGVSNGAAFAPDGRTMYWADTLRDTVWAYDYDPDKGERAAERVFLDFADLPGRPDGACVDETGCYWVACVTGSAVLRATPEGRVDRIVELPVEKPTMPAFGGPDLRTMFVTSIGDAGSVDPTPGGSPAGALFALDVGVAGIAEPAFAG